MIAPLCLLLLGVGDGDAVSKARPADVEVGLALKAEVAGKADERAEHLARAVLADPSHTAARGLLGMILDQGRWRRPEQVQRRVDGDAETVAKLAEYNGRRARAPETADGQLKLAQWCEAQGLDAEAKAHYTAVTRLEPGRAEAWKKLGCKKVDGRWRTESGLAAERADHAARAAADKHWLPKLKALRAALRDPSKRAVAEGELNKVDDPRAVPSIVRVFGGGDAPTQALAVQMLGQLEGPDASRALVAMAVGSDSPEVRARAGQTLVHRDPRESIDLLIGLLKRPIKFEVRPVGGPGSPGALYIQGPNANEMRLYSPPRAPTLADVGGGMVVYDQDGMPVVYQAGRSGTIGVAGHEVHLTTDQYMGKAPMNAEQRLDYDRALKDPKNKPSLVYSHMFSVWHDPGVFYERPLGPRAGVNLDWEDTQTYAQTVRIPLGEMVAASERTAAGAERHLEADVARLKAANAATRRDNDVVTQALGAVAGRSLGGDDPEAWRKWWVDAQGYAYKAPAVVDLPTVVQNMPLDYVGVSVPVVTTTDFGKVTAGNVYAGVPTRHHSCFAAGTAVRTKLGPRPIETLLVGDLVLTQDGKTGSLDFQPVLRTYHNPPADTLAITYEGEKDPVVATPIHRFWRVGKGWAMARDLKVGDRIRTLDGPSTVGSVSPSKVQPVFNLEVAAHGSFLVGERGALVHDNSLVEPAREPFDAIAGR